MFLSVLSLHNVCNAYLFSVCINTFLVVFFCMYKLQEKSWCNKIKFLQETVLNKVGMIYQDECHALTYSVIVIRYPLFISNSILALEIKIQKLLICSQFYVLLFYIFVWLRVVGKFLFISMKSKSFRTKWWLFWINNPFHAIGVVTFCFPLHHAKDMQTNLSCISSWLTRPFCTLFCLLSS